MGDDHLNHLGVLSIELRRAKTLDMNEFLKHFGFSHKKRIIVLL